MEKQQKLGQTIKLFRQLQKMSQDTLAVGICTTSYLSRIENGLVKADDSVYQLLLERLNIDYKDLLLEGQYKSAMLERIYMQLLSNEQVNIDDLEQLQYLHESRAMPAIQQLVDFVYCRYLLSECRDTEAKAILRALENLVIPSFSREWQLYVCIKAFSDLSEKNYHEILNREIQTNSRHYLSTASSFEKANYLYHLAFASHRAYQFAQAKMYIHLVDETFTHSYKPLFQLKLYSMKGVIYNSLGQFDKALLEYKAAEDLLQNVSAIATNEQWASLYNNLAFAYESNGQYEEAIQCYELALSYTEDIHTAINYARVLLFAHRLEQLSVILIDIKKVDLDQASHHYMQVQLILAIRNYLVNGDLDPLSIIEKQVFKYFEAHQHIELILSYGKVVAKLYEHANQYKRSTKLYKTLFETSEMMQRRVSSL